MGPVVRHGARSERAMDCHSAKNADMTHAVISICSSINARVYFVLHEGYSRAVSSVGRIAPACEETLNPQ